MAEFRPKPVVFQGRRYVPVVGIVRQKNKDGTPALLEVMRDDDQIDLSKDPAREFVVFLGVERVFGKKGR